ncbi:hypothetical protein LSUB1_G005110 [Lachnellula subtilissima]|uniref:Uncharacterized protein n=1 Tax=Lachnellula subtilissima TaxID=602034 RepID=A0A8H8RM32_9HELO|nr:hypothetical protein LSUB1_G005110 [Lachnellula subtilissima]
MLLGSKNLRPLSCDRWKQNYLLPLTYPQGEMAGIQVHRMRLFMDADSPAEKTMFSYRSVA